MSKVYVVDDDAAVRDGLAALLDSVALEVEDYGSAEEFLAGYEPGISECVLMDLQMPGMSGLEAQAEMGRRQWPIPIVFLTAHGDIPASVEAIKAGALDFLTKPVNPSLLLDRVRTAIAQGEERYRAAAATIAMRGRLSSLSQRERSIMQLILAGQSAKEIARDLGISHRTVEFHRANVLRKMGAGTLLELARLTEQSQI